MALFEVRVTVLLQPIVTYAWSCQKEKALAKIGRLFFVFSFLFFFVILARREDKTPRRLRPQGLGDDIITSDDTI